VAGPAELEVAQLLALADVLAGPHIDDAGRHVRHPNGDEGHQTDRRVVSPDDHDRPGRHVSEVGLGVGRLRRVLPDRVGLGVVGAVDHPGADHGAGDGAVPAVVVRGTEERLVDGAADEPGNRLIVVSMSARE